MNRRITAGHLHEHDEQQGDGPHSSEEEPALVEVVPRSEQPPVLLAKLVEATRQDEQQGQNAEEGELQSRLGPQRDDEGEEQRVKGHERPREGLLENGVHPLSQHGPSGWRSVLALC